MWMVSDYRFRDLSKFFFVRCEPEKFFKFSKRNAMTLHKMFITHRNEIVKNESASLKIWFNYDVHQHSPINTVINIYSTKKFKKHFWIIMTRSHQIWWIKFHIADAEMCVEAKRCARRDSPRGDWLEIHEHNSLQTIMALSSNETDYFTR